MVGGQQQQQQQRMQQPSDEESVAPIIAGDAVDPDVGGKACGMDVGIRIVRHRYTPRGDHSLQGETIHCKGPPVLAMGAPTRLVCLSRWSYYDHRRNVPRQLAVLLTGGCSGTRLSVADGRMRGLFSAVQRSAAEGRALYGNAMLHMGLHLSFAHV